MQGWGHCTQEATPNEHYAQYTSINVLTSEPIATTYPVFLLSVASSNALSSL